MIPVIPAPGGPFGRAAVLAVLVALGGCARAPAPAPVARPATVTTSVADSAFMDTVEVRTFRWFWDTANPQNGLVPDRWPSPSFSSVAAVGFGLSAYPAAVERGWVTREAARERALTTLRFFWRAPQDTLAAGATGYRGFFYHFLDMQTGHRFEQVELSTIDTALLLGGVLTCQMYFDGPDAAEAEIRALADSIYRRVDWQWAVVRPPRVSMGWRPDSGFIAYDWRGYDESMLLYVLALGSPTHPVDPAAWAAFTSTYTWGTFEGEEYLQFAPHFGHQYSHVWIDFRGIQDAYMRERGIDYFENSRRATRAQRAYAIRNPEGWVGYGAEEWGLTASDGPVDTVLVFDGRPRRFISYAARGAGAVEVRDDGTLAPTAAGGSMPFAPEIALPALRAMRQRHDTVLFTRYGFLDSYNPSFTFDSLTLTHGRVIRGRGWYDTDHLGIDQGALLLMIENHRSELIWRLLRRNPYIRDGLRKAGFRGGWLEEAVR
ncbi:MAG TPA: glucoamylase family protein [Gemmatimonadaceae bacterium]|nr:glucoamylase family protein [Gemmatimonadaceae bacterium]